jgi:hypothetical protein
MLLLLRLVLSVIHAAEQASKSVDVRVLYVLLNNVIRPSHRACYDGFVATQEEIGSETMTYARD